MKSLNGKTFKVTVNLVIAKYNFKCENFLRLQSCAPVVAGIARLWIEALKSGNKVMFCGNGGSAADAV